MCVCEDNFLRLPGPGREASGSNTEPFLSTLALLLQRARGIWDIFCITSLEQFRKIYIYIYLLLFSQYTVLNTHHLLSTYPWPPAAGQPDPAPAQYTALICSRPAKTNPCVVERGTKTVTNAHLADIPIFLLPDSVDFFRVRKQPLKTGSRNHILKSYTGNIFIHDYQFYGKS